MFRMFPDTASIKQNGFCLFHILCQFIATFPQIGHNQFTIQHIHLAANGFNIKLVVVIRHHLYLAFS